MYKLTFVLQGLNEYNKSSTLLITKTLVFSGLVLNSIPTQITVKCIGQRSGTCYSASYMSQTRDQKRFTISEVAADWHELMIPQRIMRPSIASISEQLDPRFAASRHTTAPISHTRPSPRSPL